MIATFIPATRFLYWVELDLSSLSTPHGDGTGVSHTYPVVTTGAAKLALECAPPQALRTPPKGA